MGIDLRLIFAAISLVTLSQSTLLKAEPSEHIRTLMEKPVTLLDWGMYQVTKGLRSSDKWSIEEKRPEFSVSYDWTEDNIVINLGRWDETANSYETAERQCKKDFEKIDNAFLIVNGKNMIESVCLLCMNFAHNGWTNDAVDKAGKNMGDKVLVKINLSDYSCSRKLMETEVSVLKK